MQRNRNNVRDAHSRKPGIKIMPRDKNKFVYMIGLQGPLFKINLEPGKFCVIKNVIVVHSAQNSADKFSHVNPDTDLKKKANVKSLEQFKISQDMDCCVLVNSGGVILRRCTFLLNALPKNLKYKVPCVVSMKGTRVNIVESEFRGGENNLTSALLLINSNVTVSACKFTNFRAGVIFCVSTRDEDPLCHDSEEEEAKDLEELEAENLSDNGKLRKLRAKKTLRNRERYGEKQGQVLIADCTFSKSSVVGIYS